MAAALQMMMSTEKKHLQATPINGTIISMKPQWG